METSDASAVADRRVRDAAIPPLTREDRASLFRYMEMMQNNNLGGFNPGIAQRWVLATQVINKASGKRLYDPANRGTPNGNAQFAGFTVDARRGALNLIGYTNTVQIYINDGKQPPPPRNDGGVRQPVPNVPPAPGNMPLPGPGRIGRPGGVRPLPLPLPPQQ